MSASISFEPLTEADIDWAWMVYQLTTRAHIEQVVAWLVCAGTRCSVLMAADEYAAWQETAYLFRSPTIARRLLDAYDRTRGGRPSN